MVRILYAGYLAFALSPLYPMVQNTLTFSTDCVRNALPGGAHGLSTSAASGVDGHANRCVPTTQVGAATARLPEIH